MEKEESQQPESFEMTVSEIQMISDLTAESQLIKAEFQVLQMKQAMLDRRSAIAIAGIKSRTGFNPIDYKFDVKTGVATLKKEEAQAENGVDDGSVQPTAQ